MPDENDGDKKETEMKSKLIAVTFFPLAAFGVECKSTSALSTAGRLIRLTRRSPTLRRQWTGN
jgi:hypothetical protein